MRAEYSSVRFSLQDRCSSESQLIRFSGNTSGEGRVPEKSIGTNMEESPKERPGRAWERFFSKSSVSGTRVMLNKDGCEASHLASESKMTHKLLRKSFLLGARQDEETMIGHRRRGKNNVFRSAHLMNIAFFIEEIAPAGIAGNAVRCGACSSRVIHTPMTPPVTTSVTTKGFEPLPVASGEFTNQSRFST